MGDGSDGLAEGEVVLLRVRAGAIADAGSWVYVWCRVDGDRRVVYVGATGLHPATRTWLHLHDPDPAVGRVSALLPSAATDPLDVVAMRVPPEGSRPQTKAAVIARLGQEGLLSDDYVGDAPPTLSDACPASIRSAELLAEKVAAHIAAGAS
jgi:hypothetical protein